MTPAPSLADVRDAAAQWIVRLHDGAVSDAELLEFDHWLDLSPDHRRAYDEALDTWLQLDGRAAAAGRDALPARTRSRTPRTLGWAAMGAAGLAMAASIAVVVWPLVAGPTRSVVYSTGRGEHRALQLADGSRLELNALTRVSVEFSGRERRVNLLEGEAALDVVHNPDRPFVVATAAGVIRDVGTEFDVRQRGGALSLTVSRGAVDFEQAGQGAREPVRLTPGQRLDYAAEDGAISVRTVAAEDDFGWRNGRLVLRNQSLGALVDELNLYFEHPIRVSPELAQQRVSGVLRVDTEEATLHRLTLFAPVRVESRDGEVLLQPAAQGRRP